MRLEDAVLYADEIEAGRFPPCFEDRAAACSHLEKLLVAEDYLTAADRSAAQALIGRLSRMRHADEDRPRPAALAVS
jgi:hypothetical protein